MRWPRYPQGKGMAATRAEIASQVPQQGLFPVRLLGGPWDGQDIYVRDVQAPLLQVNGPRRGLHSVWIAHLYERRGQRYEYVRTEVTPLSAWLISAGRNTSRDETAS